MKKLCKQVNMESGRNEYHLCELFYFFVFFWGGNVVRAESRYGRWGVAWDQGA